MLTMAPAANAHYFSGPVGYADSRAHTYCSSETNQADHDRLDGFVYNSMLHLSRQTVMTQHQVSCTTSTDFYWFATQFSDPSTLGAVTCRNWLQGNVCDRFRMRFNEDRLGRTDRQVRHTACHEISHTLGSADGLQTPNGCFPQSRYSDGTTLVPHEEGHIDGRYQV